MPCVFQGGRAILRLYGYTVEQSDGMCFPEDVLEPDHGKVAAVTVEVAMLQSELDQLRKGTHPHPELFSRLLPGSELPPQGGHQQETADRTPSASNADPQQPFQMAAVTAPLEACCAVCSKEEVDVHCRNCHWLLCQDCDALYHRHPSRGGHQRTPLRTGEQDTAPPSEATVGRSPILGSWPGLPGMAAPPASEEDDVGPRAARPGLGRRSLSADQQSSRPPAARADRRASDLAALTLPRPPWACASCGLVNEARAVLCGACERPRASPAPVPVAGEARAGALPRGSWCCRACTFRNEPSAVLCSTCERPRLAGRPSFGPAMAERPSFGPAMAERPSFGPAMADRPSFGPAMADRPSFGPAMADRPSFGPAMADRPSFGPAVADRPSFGPAMADRPSFGPAMADRPSFGLRKPDISVLDQTLAPTPVAAPQVTGWECQHCTFFNRHPGRICVMCDRTSSRPAGQDLRPLLGAAISHAKVLKLEEEGSGPAPGGGGGTAAAIADRARQEEIRAAGLRLVHLIRLGEEQQRSPEEMFCALRCSGTESPLAWLQTELPQVLDSVADLASQEGQTAAENQVGTVTRGEARGAWLDCGGDFEEAVRECVRTRTRKFREIRAMGFADQQEVLQALYMNGGDVNKAVIDLQRQLLEPFHTQIWQETEAIIRLDQPDRQVSRRGPHVA
ncbi:E3 ubiquitin-protein ligase RNF31-like, partial [Cetorhinus maximus]